MSITAANFDKARQYWVEKLSGELNELLLAGDFSRTGSYDEKNYKILFDREVTAQLIRIGKNNDLSIYILLLTVLKIFLYKFTGQEDVIVCSPTLSKSSQHYNRFIALRDYIHPDLTFKELLMAVTKTAIDGYKNQFYPWRKIMKILNLSEDFSLFRVMFLSQDIHEQKFLEEAQKEYEIDMIFSVKREENTLTGDIAYNANLFKEETIERLFGYFFRVLEGVLNDTGIKISLLDILSKEEKHELLRDCAGPRTITDSPATIHELFERQAQKTPGGIALVVDDRPDSDRMFLSYRELSARSNRWACYLKNRGVKTESAAALLLNRSIDIVVGMLGILKAGACYLPIDIQYPVERIEYILKDSSADILLVEPDFLPRLQGMNFHGIVLDIDCQELQAPGKCQELPGDSSNPNSLAYIIYTSGSTGNPRGVLVEHRSVVRLVNNPNYINLAAMGESGRLLLTGTIAFDITTFEIWGPLLNGLRLYTVDREIILDPQLLRKTIEKDNITILHLIPQLFNQLAGQSLDIFVGLRYLMVGGDVVNPSYINRVREKHENLEVLHMYGPTENTTFSTFLKINRNFKNTIPIGKPISNSNVYILGRGAGLLPPGAVGELYLGGEGLARGYLNQPELTHKKFINKRQKLYKTGDLGRWLVDKNIEFTGRRDFQVKIRGHRIELSEIENRLLGYNGVKDAVVTAKEKDAQDRYLCAYVIPGKEIGESGLRKYVAQALPDYMIPAYFMFLEKFPLTPNGKINRRALPEPEIKITHYTAPRDEVEERIVGMWSEVLGIDKKKIGIDSNFFELGGHSLKATIFSAMIRSVFNVNLPLPEIFNNPGIREISHYIKHTIKKTSKPRFTPVEMVEKKEYYELSSAQKRLYIIQQLDNGETGYNMPARLLLEGDLKIQRVREVLRVLIKRHESLRTSFDLLGGTPIQRIHEEVEFRIENDDIDAVRPFDLSQAPLLRVGLKQTAAQEHILMLDMHHIITDGISMNIFREDFMDLYSNPEMDFSPLKIRYRDYSDWQNRRKKQEGLKDQEDYWLNVFSGDIPVLHLPLDYSRPVVQVFEGDTLSFDITLEEKRALEQIALKAGATLYMVLLSILNVFLSKLSNQEDIVVGTVTSGRKHTDFQQVMGMFVNTLALRNYPIAEKTFLYFLGEVKRTTLEAFENQDYQYEDLVEKAPVRRDASRNPLFDVMFVFENTGSQGIEYPGLKLVPIEYNRNIAKFDLTLLAMELEGSLMFRLEYCSRLFTGKTMQRLAGYFKKIISSILEAPGKNLYEIAIISEKEKSRLLFDFNDTRAVYPADQTLHRLFAGQVERAADHIVLIGTGLHTEKLTPGETAQTPGGDISVTFRELNRKADQLAFLLREKGVRPDTIVGIMLERCPEMIIGILGILKAGGAYLPIDPGYPMERIQYMLADSSAKILVTTSTLAKEMKGNHESIYIDSLEVCNVSTSYSLTSRPSGLAYIIYTSGTSGQPKGVLIEHKHVVRLLFNDRFPFDFDETDAWTLFHSFCFDFSVWEMYGAMLYGGRSVIIPRLAARSPGAFLKILKKENVTVLNQTPSAFYQLMDEELNAADKQLNLKYVIFGGEALKPGKLMEWKNKYPGIKLINMYGITETTVHATIKEITAADIEAGTSNIGKPIPTLSTYIMGNFTDRHLKLSPIGVPGECCVGGEGVARGYLNRPGLTRDKFLENPYKPGELLYRSGDLCRLKDNGEIEYLGRMDQQVKIRGYRIEPGEIEAQLLKNELIKEALVITRQDKYGEPYLCCYWVPIAGDTRENKGQQLREYLSGLFPGYMIPSYFICLDEIPLTSNGKPDRRALPEPAFISNDNYTAPGNELERKLAAIWMEVLNPGGVSLTGPPSASPTLPGIDDDFFEQGGHSLKAVLLTNRIHKEFNIKIPLDEIFKTPTIRGLSTFMANAGKDRYVGLEPAEEKEFYPVSAAQNRLFVLYQMHNDAGTGNPGYNLSMAIQVKGKLEIKKLEQVFRQLIRRHENFRTCFDVFHGEPVQLIHDRVKFEIEQINWEAANEETPGSCLPIDGIIQKFIRPFDLSRPPLLRAGLIRRQDEHFLLLLDMHHIITDGISLGILTNEFMVLYSGEVNNQLLSPIRYRDYSQWQQHEEYKNSMEQQENYWLKQFEGNVPLLNLPMDNPRPPVLNYEGKSVEMEIGPMLCQQVHTLIPGTKNTLSMVFLAVYYVLLSKYSGQEDIVIGIPTAGRSHPDLQDIIGMFVNMLAIRNYPRGPQTFKGFLAEVQSNLLNAYKNQDYPFIRLVNRLKIKGDLNRNPLFDAAFSYEETEDTPGLAMSNLEFIPVKLPETRAHFDITLFVYKKDEQINISLRCASQLFHTDTIKQMNNHYREIMEQVVDNPDIPLEQIKISSDLLAGQYTHMQEDGDFGF